jgi:hypothetical protein
MMNWLPCFMAAANVMGMQMAMQNALPHATVVAEHAELPCHEDTNHYKSSPSASHNCTFCAFCVVGSAISATPTLKMAHVKTPTIQPTSFDVAFSSQDYPPAIKPPILN